MGYPSRDPRRLPESEAVANKNGEEEMSESTTVLGKLLHIIRASTKEREKRLSLPTITAEEARQQFERVEKADSPGYWRCPHCGHDDCWFDRRINVWTDSAGKTFEEGPFTRCMKCGKADSIEP